MSTEIDRVSQYGHFPRAFALLAVHEDNPECDKPATNDTFHDYLRDIVDQSSEEWNALLNHPFHSNLAKGAPALNGFRHYTIQNLTHAMYFYRARMETLAKSGTMQELNTFSRNLSVGLSAVQSTQGKCTNILGVPKDDVENEPRSRELEEFVDFASAIAKDGDYLDFIVADMPGILGYDIITKGLVNDSDTVRNTVYYTLFIEPLSRMPAQKHITYVNQHIASLSDEERESRCEGWVRNFKKGCIYETDFASLASVGNFPTYNVVKDRLYRIRSYHRGNPYLTPDQSTSVTISQTKDGLWKLTNSPDGYTIQNMNDHSFLSAIVQGPLQPTYGVFLSLENHHKWSINPAQVAGSGPHTAYQLLVSGRLQYAVDAGSNDEGNPKVYVSNNAHMSSQFWFLEEALECQLDNPGQ